MNKPTIAIIGTGIAGMGAGYFLREGFDLTFYEKNDYPGGHTNTQMIEEGGSKIPIDTAFMVYNEKTYPNLTRLFKELGVETKPTDMSFSVQHLPSGLEYCGSGVNGLFAQRKNIFNLRFIHMLTDMNRFNQDSVEILENPKYQSYSLREYVDEQGYGNDFYYKFLVPMSSAVWSMSPKLIDDFPAATLVRFFKNHGFLGLTTHFQWRTVTGGSRNYRDRIFSMINAPIKLNCPVGSVRREGNKAAVADGAGDEKLYDKAILACHADQALSMLMDATPRERDALGAFRYQKNRATLHTDTRLMPKAKRAWSSWNYRIQKSTDGTLVPNTVYYMNKLQQVSKRKHYFISINDPGNIDPQTVLWERDYEHPVYDVPAIQAQRKLSELNMSGPVYFCGSYFKYGFHEDALTAGMDVARTIRGEDIWK